ncbi:RNA-binding protein [Philodulcilactobacillus myokoensis]|uniref:RNA-binding protein n=1 Tax=Philodulcilactobacillus myokoensis TaxID=2929573 RepID=A0A9W6ET05_9LACO|nr:YlmH/Sll1252 family protein [Philodulcilactobacillus myokoensis]GLB47017.1 RNA-binding protein [Philodulcilactobacillus myokoensis]
MNNNIKQHFRKNEAPFLEYSDDLVNEVLSQYRPILTNFINPRQLYLLKTIVNHYNDVKLSYFGGSDNAEMQRAIIHPDYFQPQKQDFKLTLFNIDYPVKFNQINHSQILGTLMGTGIKRNVIGDIYTDGKIWQFLTEKEMEPYFRSQIDRVGRVKVGLESENLSKLVQPIDEWHQSNGTVSSLRIDNIVSTGFHLSRKNSKILVKNGKIHVNWMICMHSDYELQIHDLISVRGFGRLRIDDVSGITKKNKIRIVIAKLKK